MKYFVFLSVVTLLGSVQRLAVTSVEIMPNSLMNEATNELYQGDMVLTDEQRRALVFRKAINDTRYRWPKSADGMVDIEYRFGDAVVNRPGVVRAMSLWQQATCVKFNEIPAQVARPHLIYITSATSCSSNVGQAYFQNGQNVNLMPSCFDGGEEDTVVHELGHALGLWHEQSRSDRDDYLYIMTINVETGKERNFDKEDSNNYGLPYDYSSIMQYGPTAFSKNGLNTIVAKDPLAQPLIDDHKGLSFMDKKIVNLMYNCMDTWLAKCNLTTNPCQNQGYTKSNCSCECPAGTSGANCETLSQPYTAALISAKSPGSVRITTAGTVTSPGYPTPVKTATSSVQSIEAPECNTVKLTFNVFDMRGLSNLSSDNWATSFLACWNMILEIRLDDPPITGTEYCGANITATEVFQSVGRFMVLTFSSRNMTSNTKTGYNATVEFVPVTTGNCTPTATTTTATPTTTPTTESTTESTTTLTTTESTTESTTMPTTTPTPTPTTESTTTLTITPTTGSTTESTTTPTTTSATTPTTTPSTTPTTESTTTPTTESTTESTTTPATTSATTPTTTLTTESTTTPTTTPSTTLTTTPTTESTTTLSTTSTTTPTATPTTTITTESTTIPTTTSTTTPTTTPTTTSTTTPTTTTRTTTRTTSTTTAALSPGTFINSGRLPLTPSISSGLCKLVSSANPSVYFYRSPNYPGNYGWGQRCTIWFNTTEPRYLKVTPLILNLGLLDSMDLYSAYKTTTYLDARKVGTAITLPTTSSRLNFQDFFLSPGGRFNIKVEVVNNACHQLIKLDARSTGPLNIPANYPPGTICEWWLRAPAGRKVQVSFSRFFIGGSTCLRDYVVIDLTGDSRYVTNSRRYCGGNAFSPGTVVSTGNALNILVNGQWGNYQGLMATYKVV